MSILQSDVKKNGIIRTKVEVIDGQVVEVKIIKGNAPLKVYMRSKGKQTSDISLCRDVTEEQLEEIAKKKAQKKKKATSILGRVS